MESRWAVRTGRKKKKRMRLQIKHLAKKQRGRKELRVTEEVRSFFRETNHGMKKEKAFR